MNPRSPLQSTSSELIDETVAIGDVSDMLVQAAQSLAGSGSGSVAVDGKPVARLAAALRRLSCDGANAYSDHCIADRAAQLRRAIRLEPAYRGSASADHHASRVTGAWHTAHGARPACRRHVPWCKTPLVGSEGPFPLSEKQAAKLADRTVVRVKFLKDDMTQSGDFSIVEIDGAKYGKIDFNKGVIRYASDRFLEIELVTNTVTGLKIPLSSIVTKEFYLIPSDYATTNEDSQETGFMVLGKDKSGNETRTFVNPSIYASIEDGSQDTEDESKKKYLYYVDQKSFKEGDVIISQKDQSRYVVSDVGVLEGVYCINRVCRISQNRDTGSE